MLSLNFRPELKAMPGQKNPLLDVKVRQAMWHAIDLETIKKRVMRDKSRNTGTLVAPPVPGYAKENDTPLAYDPTKAKQLLTEAGYPNGFKTKLNCPNDRYINDEQTCVAIASMWAKVGIQAELQTESRATYFPRQDRGEFDVSMVGWATLPPMDGFSVLSSLLTEQKDGYGGSNAGTYSNPKIEELTRKAAVELDETKRRAMLVEALKVARDDGGVHPAPPAARGLGRPRRRRRPAVPGRVRPPVVRHHQVTSQQETRGPLSMRRAAGETPMFKVLLSRLGQAALVMLVVSAVSFVMFRYVGDPVATMSRENASVEEKAELRRSLGLDQPLVVQYGRFLSRTLSGDLGISYRNQRPVTELIAERLPATLELVIVATFLSLALGIPLGVLCALKPNGVAARLVQAVSLVGISTPTFVTGIVLILVFAVSLGWLPSFGRGQVVDLGWWSTGFLTSSGLKSLLLPGITLALYQLTLIMRLVRAEMIDVLSSDYIRFAKARGLPTRYIHFRLALRNALMPVITVTGLQIGSLIAFAIVTETVFQWPGMGLLFIQAVSFVDIPVMAAYLLFVGLLFVLINTVVDILYAVVDPRLRARSA